MIGHQHHFTTYHMSMSHRQLASSPSAPPLSLPSVKDFADLEFVHSLALIC